MDYPRAGAGRHLEAGGLWLRCAQREHTLDIVRANIKVRALPVVAHQKGPVIYQSTVEMHYRHAAPVRRGNNSLTGWLVSVVIRTEAQATVGLNVLAGTVGAILGGLMLAPLVGTGSVSALLTSFGGVAIVLAATHYFRRGAVR